MRAFEATIAAIILVAGVVLGWIGGCFYADLVSIPAAREAGRIEERLVWTKRQAEAEAKAAASAWRRRPASTRSSENTSSATRRASWRWTRSSNPSRRSKRMSRHPARPLAALLMCAVLPPLAGCATRSTPPVVVLQLARVPASLLQPCADVADLPERDLTTAETARLWGRDRQSLGACRDRHAALADAAQALEGQGRASDHDGHQ